MLGGFLEQRDVSHRKFMAQTRGTRSLDRLRVGLFCLVGLREAFRFLAREKFDFGVLRRQGVGPSPNILAHLANVLVCLYQRVVVPDGNFRS